MAIQTQRGKIWEDRIQDMVKKSSQNLADGAITETYKANKEEVIQLLNRALSSEWTAFMQYWHHYFMATDIHSREIKESFKEAADQELHHIDEIGNRIQLLGGVPNDKPEEIANWWPVHVEYGHDLRSMLEADLKAERLTIEFYGEIVRYCGFDDIVTRNLFEEILGEEEAHGNELADLLYALDASTGQQITGPHGEKPEKTGYGRLPRAA